MKDAVSIEPAVKLIHVPCAIEINNVSVPQDLESLVILYMANQSVDPQLWNDNFCPISLFRLDEYLEEDAESIICSLLRIAVFIRQCKLKNRIAENISQILKFGFMAWKFLFSIYESG